jgi:uncharacterized protein YndB with AHSA1/START domain
MDAPLTVEREIEIDLSAEELWELIATAAGWEQWMVDTASLAVQPGEAGEVEEDGVRRTVSVAEVRAGESVTFHWAEVGRADDLSVVRLDVIDDERGSRLRITEQWLAPAACADCPLRAGTRWDLRECFLCLTTLTSCRV